MLTNISQQLREIGYTVSKANSFAEAQVVLGNGAQFDVLVTDYIWIFGKWAGIWRSKGW